MYTKQHLQSGTRLNGQPHTSTETEDKAESAVLVSSKSLDFVFKNVRFNYSISRHLSENSMLSKPKSAEFLFDDYESSPSPSIVFFPQPGPKQLELIYLQKTLDEVVYTERSYLEKLYYLKKMYLDSVSSNIKIELPTPIVIIRLCLEQIINIHETILYDLDDIMSNKITNIKKQVDKVSVLLAQIGLNNFWYSWFCMQHETVGKTFNEAKNMSNKTNFENINRSTQSMVQGVRNLIEAGQVGVQNKDLSFSSLCRQPISRILKYPLFLKDLSKKYSILGFDNTILEKNLSILHRSLDQINDAKKNFDESIQILKTSLDQLIDFEHCWGNSVIDNNSNSNNNDKHKESKNDNPYICSEYNDVELNIDFFGDPVLIGFSAVITVHNGKPKVHHCPLILFKSHLLILKYRNIIKRNFEKQLGEKNGKKFKVDFIIPLANTTVYCESKNFNHGLHLISENTIKLVFRVHYVQFEVVLYYPSRLEFRIWRAHFRVMVNEVNCGSCEFADDANIMVRLHAVPQEVDTYCQRNLETSKVFHYKHIKVSLHAEWCLHDRGAGETQILRCSELAKVHYKLVLKALDVFINERLFAHLVSAETHIYFNKFH